MEYLLLALLSVKHFAFDYPFQTQKEISNKGFYGNPLGLLHSLKHGLATTGVLIFFFFGPISLALALALGFLDFITHYHIDWIKVKLTSKIEHLSKKWWVLFGVDQLLHTLNYIVIVWLAMKGIDNVI